MKLRFKGYARLLESVPWHFSRTPFLNKNARISKPNVVIFRRLEKHSIYNFCLNMIANSTISSLLSSYLRLIL
jgi:hypothetical protein